MSSPASSPTFRERLWRIVKGSLYFFFFFHLSYVIVLRWVDPPITITQLVNWVQGNGLKRDYVDRSEISAQAMLAVMSSEDQLFHEHSGFLWDRIRQALKHNERRPDKIRGGSTISQQTAKNVFLWQGRSYVRKGLEFYFTFLIELFWGKERIMEVYLNVIEMGRGIFGIEAAARYYFNKPASRLNRQEASLIAAVLPSPKRYKIKPLSGYVSGRARSIQTQMGHIAPIPEIQELLHSGTPGTY
ncbi:MAG: monofunctional biosynthetic peptidoglycan transglycosylase [Bacteroidetes bacterium]|nr:monofunctional biosynthetic peptidoglycan transglycosylase [Bacteroidota bacterium]